VRPKPKHLGPEYAAQFADRGVVEAYRFRPPYPDQVFDVLAGLAGDEPRAVLDAGCGRGEIARPLVGRVGRVDAIDVSQPMIEAGRRLPRGDHPNLSWIHGPVETAPLRPPYALVVAGESLHWMEWAVVMPRFRAALSPRGLLALVDRSTTPNPWDAAVLDVIGRFSTNRGFQPYDLLHELTARDLFRLEGEERTATVPFRQSVEDYVESFHSRNGLSRERMGAEAASAFDAAVRACVLAHRPGGDLELDITGVVRWGQPAPVG
jgi:trans-aconitate methyltransferase